MEILLHLSLPDSHVITKVHQWVLLPCGNDTHGSLLQVGHARPFDCSSQKLGGISPCLLEWGEAYTS